MAIEPISKKEQLLNTLARTEESAGNLAGRARSVLRDAEESKEVAQGLKRVVSEMPDDSAMPQAQWDHVNAAFLAQDRQNSMLANSIDPFALSATTQSSTATTTNMILSYSFVDLAPTPATE